MCGVCVDMKGKEGKGLLYLCPTVNGLHVSRIRSVEDELRFDVVNVLQLYDVRAG